MNTNRGHQKIRRYYVTFNDDFSRRAWIYFLKTKDEVFSNFAEFKAFVEIQTRRNIKVICSDNRGEYTSGKFDSLCRKTSIKKELVISYNPQQNGVVEKKKRAIVDTVNSLIHDMNVQMTFNVEACNMAMYILNRCLHRILRKWYQWRHLLV